MPSKATACEYCPCWISAFPLSDYRQTERCLTFSRLSRAHPTPRHLRSHQFPSEYPTFWIEGGPFLPFPSSPLHPLQPRLSCWGLILKMHQLTSGFILLLLFTLSTVSSLPTLNPEAKDIVRENSLIQGAIPKFVSKGVVHGGEGGEESTEIQVKNDKEEQEEEGDDASTMIGSIVANRNHDEIKPEKKSWESPDRGKEEKTDGENNGEVNVEDEVEVIIESQDDEDKSQLEAIVDVDIGNDNSEQGRNEVEVDIENNNEESRGEGSSEVKVEARTDKHSGDGDGEGKAEAGAIVEETEERCDGRHDGKDEFSAEYHPETKYALIISPRK